MSEVISLLAFSWKTDRLRFCDGVNHQTNCLEKDFWPLISNRIQTYEPTLVAWGLEESRPIHIIEEMAKIGYIMIGTGKSIAVQLQIFSRAPEAFTIQDVIKYQNGITLIIKLPNNQRWGISVIQPGNLITSLQKLVYNPVMAYSTVMITYDNKSKCNPNISISMPNSCLSPSDLPYLIEGIDNRGPDFPPTCYLSQKRKGNYEEPLLQSINSNNPIPKSHQVTPSDFNQIGWCDRIYYGTFQMGPVGLECLEYQRLDDPGTNLVHSKHAVVYSLLSFKYFQ